MSERPTAGLTNEQVFRGTVVALRLWHNTGRLRPWDDQGHRAGRKAYRDSALAWLQEASARLQAEGVSGE